MAGPLSPPACPGNGTPRIPPAPRRPRRQSRPVLPRPRSLLHPRLRSAPERHRCRLRTPHGPTRLHSLPGDGDPPGERVVHLRPPGWVRRHRPIHLRRPRRHLQQSPRHRHPDGHQHRSGGPGRHVYHHPRSVRLGRPGRPPAHRQRHRSGRRQPHGPAGHSSQPRPTGDQQRRHLAVHPRTQLVRDRHRHLPCQRWPGDQRSRQHHISGHLPLQRRRQSAGCPPHRPRIAGGTRDLPADGGSGGHRDRRAADAGLQLAGGRSPPRHRHRHDVRQSSRSERQLHPRPHRGPTHVQWGGQSQGHLRHQHPPQQRSPAVRPAGRCPGTGHRGVCLPGAAGGLLRPPDHHPRFHGDHRRRQSPGE